MMIRKNIKTMLVTGSLCCTIPMAFTSCADTDMEQLTMQEPETLAAYDYLKQYDVLKAYGDAAIMMDAQTFLDKGMDYRIAVANFSQLQPGQTMSHAQVVKANGSLDTNTLDNIISLAEKHDMTLVSSPLVWHHNQNTAYLNARLNPNIIRPEGDDGGYCMKLTNTLKSPMTDAQVAYSFAKTPQVEPGIKYKLAFMIRGTAEGIIQVATYSNGRGSRFTPNVNVTKEWRRVELITTMASGIKGLTSILFNVGQFVGTLSVDNIELYEVDSKGYEVTDNLNTVNTNLDDAEMTAESVSVQTDANKSLEDVGVSALGEGYDPLATYVEKTDEEKQDILKAEMQRYLEGVMMPATSIVTDWIVVNEPLAVVDDDASAFYWQAYLGNIGYAVNAFKEAAGHTAGKLYIGESGLENDIAKCQLLIDFISQVESQGARIDGIALTINANTKVTDVVTLGNIFALLAATGRMVKITDLRIGIGDTATEEATEEQLLAQGKMLADILKAYTDRVPASQRSAVVQHQVIDGDQPLGLWSRSFNRKHAYGSFADGIK